MFRFLLVVFLYTSFTSAALAEGTLKHPDWHPDGTLLVVEGACAGTDHLFFINLDKKRVLWSFGSSEIPGYPRWLPDGKGVSFHEFDPNRNSEILTAFLNDEPGIRTIKKYEGSTFDIEPAASPDGKHLAYSTKGPNGQNIAIRSLLDDADPKIYQTDTNDNFPSWFPDGQHLLFTSSRSGERQIYKMEVATGDVAPIELEGGPNFYGHIRHDGKMLVYASERTGDREIYLYDFETGEDVRLTNRQGRDGYPKFSPDGSRIAFHSQPDGQDYTHIVVMDLETRLEEVFSCDSVR